MYDYTFTDEALKCPYMVGYLMTVIKDNKVCYYCRLVKEGKEIWESDALARDKHHVLHPMYDEWNRNLIR